MAKLRQFDILVYDVVKEYLLLHNYAPSMRDIADRLPRTSKGTKRSTSVITKSLEKLEEEGYIKRDYYVARSITITRWR